MAKRMRVVSEMDFNLLQALKKEGKKTKADDLEERKLSILDPKSSVPDDVRTILYNDAARRLQKQTLIDTNTPVYVSTAKPGHMIQNLPVNSLPINSAQIPVEVKKTPEKEIRTPVSHIKTRDVTSTDEREPQEYQTPVSHITASDVTSTDRRKLLQSINNKKAAEILSLLESSGVTWNERNEVLIKDQRVPGSNLKSILSSLANGKDLHESPGMKEVTSILMQNEIPYRLINRSTQALLRSARFTPKLSSLQVLKSRRNSRTGERGAYSNVNRRLWENY